LKLIVGVSEMKAGKEGDVLVTHALGSCLGLMIYDPAVRVGGLLHALLPQARINPEKAEANPCMFVDTGVPALFEAVFGLGAKKNRLRIKAAGCARPLDTGEIFRIGERNFTILKMILWKNGLLLDAEDVGGSASRTVYFDLTTGKVAVSTNGIKEEL
jgi:chemotaxis protein CheD